MRGERAATIIRRRPAAVRESPLRVDWPDERILRSALCTRWLNKHGVSAAYGRQATVVSLYRRDNGVTTTYALGVGERPNGYRFFWSEQQRAGQKVCDYIGYVLADTLEIFQQGPEEFNRQLFLDLLAKPEDGVLVKAVS